MPNAEFIRWMAFFKIEADEQQKRLKAGKPNTHEMDPDDDD